VPAIVIDDDEMCICREVGYEEASCKCKRKKGAFERYQIYRSILHACLASVSRPKFPGFNFCRYDGM
jgi:hypothetical protein